MAMRDAAYYREYRARRKRPGYKPMRVRGVVTARNDRQAYDYERRYGLTRAGYDEMLAQQGGVCAACHEPETLVRRGRLVPLQIDHDHADGRIRGLLCSRCNRLLGAIESEAGRRVREYADLL